MLGGNEREMVCEQQRVGCRLECRWDRHFRGLHNIKPHDCQAEVSSFKKNARRSRLANLLCLPQLRLELPNTLSKLSSVPAQEKMSKW